MFQFIPPKSIRSIQRDYDLSPDSITESQYEEVRLKFESISSEDPLVSVVIIAYNEENNLFKTLVTLAETNCKYPVEFIVSNNNSTDRTQEIIDKCGLRTVFEKRQGYPYARQAGLSIAKGKYIISGDADTLYQPKWVEKMVEPFEKNSEVVCTYSLHAFYTEDDRYPMSLLAFQQAKTWGVYFRHYKRPQLNCGGASMAYPIDAVNEIGGYRMDVGRGEDGRLAYDLAQTGKVLMVNSKSAYIYTSMRRTAMDGSLAQAFWIRAKRYLRNLFKYLTPQNEN
jgi:glycosyltransferase involved in cell wall biosynthesis